MGRHGTHAIQMDDETQKRFDEAMEKANTAWLEHCALNEYIIFLRQAVNKELKRLFTKYGDITTKYNTLQEIHDAWKRGECKNYNKSGLDCLFAIKKLHTEERWETLLRPLENESSIKWKEFDEYRNMATQIWHSFVDEHIQRETERRKQESEQRRLERKLAKEQEKRAQQEEQESIEKAYQELTDKILTPISNEEFDKYVKCMGKLFEQAQNYTIKLEKKVN